MRIHNSNVSMLRVRKPHEEMQLIARHHVLHLLLYNGTQTHILFERNLIYKSSRSLIQRNRIYETEN